MNRGQESLQIIEELPCAVQLPETCVDRWLAKLRPIEGIEVLAVDSTVWLLAPSAAATPLLLAIPDSAAFHVLPDDQLIPFGQQLPKGTLPSGQWIPIKDWVRVSLPPVGLEGRITTKTNIQMIRSSTVKQPNLLMCDFERWKQFVLTTSVLRLQQLTFVCSKDGRAICRGWPLPTIPGEFWQATDGIAVPAGWTWRPRLDPATLFKALSRQQNGDDEGTTFLLYPDGKREAVLATDWCRTTYSSVRSSEESFA